MSNPTYEFAGFTEWFEKKQDAILEKLHFPMCRGTARIAWKAAILYGRELAAKRGGEAVTNIVCIRSTCGHLMPGQISLIQDSSDPCGWCKEAQKILAAVLHERERCAKIVEEGSPLSTHEQSMKFIADKIREGGKPS